MIIKLDLERHIDPTSGVVILETRAGADWSPIVLTSAES